VDKENLDKYNKLMEALTHTISDIELIYQLIIGLIDTLPEEDRLLVLGRLKLLIERYTENMINLRDQLLINSKDKTKSKEYTS
jgi:hypothetical protein